MEVKYEVIRSNRKSMALQIYPDGRVIVRAPLGLPDAYIRQYMKEKEAWIRQAREKIKARQTADGAVQKLSMEEIRQLADKALKVIPERVAYYAPLVGVTYGGITIRNQKSRWGSCSSKGNLNFNCLLMLAPPEVLDSVVVHELCHRLEMNHSKRFYENVLRVFPEYEKWHGWLKEHGGELMARMQ